MRTTRIAGVAIAFALAAASANAAEPSEWERKLGTARALADQASYDDAEKALREAAADPAVADSQKPGLYKQLGESWAYLAIRAVRAQDGLERSARCLAESKAWNAKYLEHPSVKDAPELAAERFGVWIQDVWNLMAVAAAHVRRAVDPSLPEARRAEHRQEAARIYQGTIQDLELALPKKEREAAVLKAKKPSDPRDREKWQKESDRVGNEHLRLRICLCQACADFAMALQEAGEPEARWKPIAQEAATGYRQILLDFRGTASVNVPLSEALILLGDDAQALERLESVWREKETFRDKRAIPCKARALAGAILVRQGRYPEALAALAEMLVARTRRARAFDPKAVTASHVEAVLEQLDDADDPEQFDRQAVANALLLVGDAYAGLAANARESRKPAAEVKALFAKAYGIAQGVAEAEVAIDAKHIHAVEAWRQGAELPLSVLLLRKLAQVALREGRYGDAARLYTDVLNTEKADPDKERETWETVAKCYYANRDYYRAYTVFTSLARRFPEPKDQAWRAACSAVSALEQHHKLTGNASDAQLLARARLDAENLDPRGVSPASYLKRAAAHREAGEFDQALATLEKIAPASSSFLYACQEAALCHQAILERLPEADRNGPKGRQALRAMLADLEKRLGECRETLPKLKEDDRQAAAEALAVGLALAVEACREGRLNQPERIRELTADMTKAYPAIERTRLFPFLVYARMRAASALADASSGQRLDELIAALEEGWKTLQATKDSRYLAGACSLCAAACDKLARLLEAKAAKAADRAAKADLAKRAAAARDRSLDFYLTFLQDASDPPIATWRYVLQSLLARAHEPKSADYRTIAELGSQAIRRYKNLSKVVGGLGRLAVPLAEAPDEHQPAIDLLHVEAAVATAHCRLGNFRDAMPLLEEVSGTLEAIYQRRMAAYEKLKQQYERDPRRHPKPDMPGRGAVHLDARRWLARCILETGAQASYPAIRRACLEDLPLYTRDTAQYWDILYWLCETLRRLGLHEEVAKHVDRALFTSQGRMGDALVKDGKGTRRDFRELVARARQDVGQLGDDARKKRLLPLFDGLLKQLGN